MIAGGLIDPQRVWALFTTIEDRLFRFPNIDAESFRSAVRGVLGLGPGRGDAAS